MDVTSIAAAEATRSTNASSQLTADFDTFLTLLTTQLQNQDPLNPLDTEKFTEQLVQFSGVEQAIQTNEHLEALLALQSASATDTALAMVGRVATVESDIAALSDAPAIWSVRLPETADSATAQVFNSASQLVASFAAPTSAGDHDIVWNGETDLGGRASAGEYQLVINAVNANGDAIAAAPTVKGHVDAVSLVGGAPSIEIAGRLFAVDAVLRVDEGA